MGQWWQELFTDIQKVMLNQEYNMKLYYTGSDFYYKIKTLTVQ